MCTLTFVPKSTNDFILTSNRDEALLRSTIPPKQYTENNQQLIYPKDSEAGGTWLGLSSLCRMVCLLNGGFEAHQLKSTYRMSRGIIVKELLSVPDAKAYINNFDFRDIEPFTVVIIQWQQQLELIELVWDGAQKHVQQLPVSARVWSSSSLYTPSMKKKRHQWFFDFLETQNPTAENLWDFHHNAGVGDKNIDLQIDRGFLKTVSISQVVKNNQTATFNYEDLQTRKLHQLKMDV